MATGPLTALRRSLRRWTDPSVRAARNREARAFWTGLPRASFAVLLAAIFCLFSTFGFLVDMAGLGRLPPGKLVFSVVFAGAIAAVYAWVGILRPRWIPLPLAVHMAVTVAARESWPTPSALPSAAAIARRLDVDMAGAVVGIVFGYVLFILFVAREGSRYFRAHEEIRLARDIHGQLVPTVRRRLGPYEAFGVSHPSGDVGGDLVDVVESPDGDWMAYVVDVSGHGVSAGVLMGMVKSAIRMRAGSLPPIDVVLNELNRALVPLRRPHMFATFAGLRSHADGVLQLSLAGHLPLLHVKAAAGGATRTVEEVHVAQIPVGFDEGYRFHAVEVTTRPGDVLALITDGLTEVFDRHDRELGLDAARAVLARCAEASLDEIADALRAAALAHGAQLDDQTVLLLRHQPGGPA
jgi:serine phosphatase RsbU (regulator of sigma subunit)